MGNIEIEIDEYFIDNILSHQKKYITDLVDIEYIYFIDNVMYLSYNEEKYDVDYAFTFYFKFTNSEILDMKLSTNIDEEFLKLNIQSKREMRLYLMNFDLILKYIKGLFKNGRIHDTIVDKEEELYL